MPRNTRSKAKAKATKPPKEEDPETEVSEEESDTFYDLSEKEMKEINNAFDLNCGDSEKESLNNTQLKTAMRALGFEPRADEIKSLVKKYSNKDKKINRDGFHKIMASKFASAPGSRDKKPKDEISRVFDLLDLEKSGFLTLQTLKSIAKELNEDIKEEELQEMIAEADLDGDNRINKDEFQEIMKKTSLY